MTRDEIKAALPILEEFERRGVEFKKHGTRLMACCPFHEDKSPSLCVDEEEQVFTCYGCNAGGSVIDAWALFEGVPVKDAFRQIEAHLGVPAPIPAISVKQPPTPSPASKLVKAYDYKDEDGKLLFQVCRFEPKDFRQRVPDGTGWKWGLNGTRRVLYDLPAVISSTVAIYFCEGEKDADLLRGMGLVATTTPMGAGKWDDAYTPFFKAKTVVVLPDNDAPGKKHCEMLCEKLGPVARAIRVVNIPSPHKDVSDWRTAFSSDQEFGMNLLDCARKAKTVAGADTLPIYDMHEMEDRYRASILNPKRVALDFTCLSPKLGSLIRPLVAGDMAVFVADTGVGKTFFLQNLAYKCGSKVLFFELELADDTMFERFAAMGSGRSNEMVEYEYRAGRRVDWQRSPLMSQNIFVCPKPGITTDQLRNFIFQSELKIGCMPEVVMVDYMGLMKGSGGSRYERLSNTAEELKTIAKETGTVIVCGSQIGRKADDCTEEINLHDAKDSGSIENSAQLVIGAWRDPDPERKTRIWTKILKNNKGAPGRKVPLQFNPQNLQIFEEANFSENGESEQQPASSVKKFGNSYPPKRMASR